MKSFFLQCSKKKAFQLPQHLTAHKPFLFKLCIKKIATNQPVEWNLHDCLHFDRTKATLNWHNYSLGFFFPSTSHQSNTFCWLSRLLFIIIFYIDKFLLDQHATNCAHALHYSEQRISNEPNNGIKEKALKTEIFNLEYFHVMNKWVQKKTFSYLHAECTP